MTGKEGERIAILENQMLNLNKTVDDGFRKVGNDILELRNLIMTGYSSKEFVIEKLADVEKELSNLKRTNGLWKWMSPTLSSILTAIVTFLVIEYFKNG